MKGVFFMRREGKKRGKREAVRKGGWQSLLFGVFISVLVAVFMLAICAILIVTGILPERTGDGCVLIACSLGTLIGGRAAMKGQGKHALLSALGVAALTTAAYGVTGILLYTEVELGRWFAVGGACLCGGGLSGVACGRNGVRRR